MVYELFLVPGVQVSLSIFTVRCLETVTVLSESSWIGNSTIRAMDRVMPPAYLSQVQLGIQRGDMNRFNFLSRNSEAVFARKCDENILRSGFEALSRHLHDALGRRGWWCLCWAKLSSRVWWDAYKKEKETNVMPWI